MMVHDNGMMVWRKLERIGRNIKRRWRFRSGRYVAAYLVAILIANLDIVYVQHWFGATDNVRLIVTTANAFLFIAFDLTARDGLHDEWHYRRLVPKMITLIATGSLFSWFLNRDAGQIALASFVAFAAAGVTDSCLYHALLKRGWRRYARINGSNVVSASVDSLIFPTLAFGGINWAITGGQLVAKVIGGALWAKLLIR